MATSEVAGGRSDDLSPLSSRKRALSQGQGEEGEKPRKEERFDSGDTDVGLGGRSRAKSEEQEGETSVPIR